MRLAFIHPFLFRYARGIERFTINLANVLARSGVEVHILTWNWSNPIKIDQIDAQVCVHIMPTSRYYAAQCMVPFYTRHLLKHPYDFVWIFFAGYGEAEALTLARQQRFGIVFHYPYSQVPHRYREFLRFGLVRHAKQIVSVSQFVADGVREAFGMDSCVIHHGVDANRFAPRPSSRDQIRQMLGLPQQAPLLITAAALEERKGIQHVLRALPLVLQRFPETTFVVLGEGKYREALERLVRELGVGQSVRLLGVRDNVIPFYQAADVSLILSRGEASSLTALESLACGLPVISANRPPFDELIESEYGLRVDEETVDQVAGAIVDLLGNPKRAQAMGEAGRRRVLTDFTWERVGHQYLELQS